jgi:hypothetical protein
MIEKKCHSYVEPLRSQFALLGAILFIFGSLIASGCTAPGRFVVKVHKHEIQKKLDGRFPVRKTKLVFEVRFENPVVSFNKEDQIEIGIQVKGLVAKIPILTTSAVIAGKIRYDTARHEFLLTDPHVKGLELANVPDRHVEQVRAEVDRIANRILPAIPLYRLDPKKHRLARILLKRAWVSDQTLYLEMGI